MGLRVISRGLLSAVGFAVAASHVFAEESSVTLPEVRVIANTPLAPPSPRRAARAAERSAPRAPEPEPTRGSAERPSRQAVAAPRSAAPAQAPTPAAPAVSDPALIERDKIPANVQTLSASDFDHSRAPGLLDAMSRGLPGVALEDQTGNEFQRDLDYRGFTASPVIGTPQGLAVYQNGVRVNEVFGDIVNWDFIPESAINRMTLMPSNPVYGLNALGGAISIDMKNGFTYQGGEAELRGGSFGRRSALIQQGGQVGNLSGYLAADAINDDGWRLYSPSKLRRIYTDLGARGDRSEFHITFTGASNNFGAAAATPIELLNRSWASVYTVPQSVQNQLAFLTASGSWNPTDTLSLQANAYYRGYWQRHVDGNGTSAQSCPAPDAGDDSDLGTATQAAFLCFPDLNGNLSNLIGLNGLPVVATDLLANSTLGEIDRTSTAANSFGGSVQAATNAKIFGQDNRFVIGASSDNGHVQFNTTSELGTINPDTWPWVQGVGIYINQPSGDVAPSEVLALTRYTGIYTTDTLDLTSRLSLTFGGRYNVAQISLRDTLGNNTGLNGDHSYSRFNPVIGLTFKVTPNVTAYAGYAEANRAPTPLELGCSDPLRPCLLDNALVGDPPLRQVVSHTYEAGLRGQYGAGGKQGLFTWNAGVFHAVSTDDIINVASPLPGHQYFQNGGSTLRQGMEAGAALKWDRWSLYANYTRVDATFQSVLILSSPNNPFADANGNIFVVPGDRIPAVPNYRFKTGAEAKVTDQWTVGADINAIGSQYLVGDQSNQNPQVPAYCFVNLHSTYQITKNVEVFGLVRNLFNQRYYTFGTFFQTDSFSYLNLTDPRTFVPGAPLAAYAGLRARW
ncbi:MAG TPA: TonB-dependent receptor [Xanthobacteraceae bacterium]